MFSKLHTYYSLLMSYSWNEFGCDLSVTKGTLLTEQRTFSSESRLLFKVTPPPKLQSLLSLRILYIWYNFGRDRSIKKGTSLGEKRNFSTVSRLLFEGVFIRLFVLQVNCLPLLTDRNQTCQLYNTHRQQQFWSFGK